MDVFCSVSRWNGEIQSKYGLLTQTRSQTIATDGKGTFAYQEGFATMVQLIPGDSGGIVINSNGELVGFNSTSDQRYSDSTHSKILDALELVVLFRAKLLQDLANQTTQ